MGNVNRGKGFENVIREAFERVPNTLVIRLPDPVQGYLGIRNICDFLIYNYPYQYCIECKSVHGNTLPLSNITDNQRDGMLEASKIMGVKAGVICWWVDRGVTKFIPIQTIVELKNLGYKSIGYNMGIPDYMAAESEYCLIPIQGRLKRVFFEYDMDQFFKEMET